jgi:hypothetical protein
MNPCCAELQKEPAAVATARAFLLALERSGAIKSVDEIPV